jgi:hypothetical protein
LRFSARIMLHAAVFVKCNVRIVGGETLG